MNPDTFDELRIIAGEHGALSSSDRVIIRRAADELEAALRMVIASNQALIESQQRHIATNEQLLEARRENAKSKLLCEPMSMGFSSSGPMKLSAL